MTRDNLDFLLRVKLIQQTPYIHFQHNQDGAILRATEVKPKLDKFIRKKMGGDVPEDWLIRTEGSTKALNYKMRFYVTGEPVKSEAGRYAVEAHNAGSKEARSAANNKMRAEINGMYFGNMVPGKVQDYAAEVEKQFRETVFYREPIEMTILCMIPELRTKIAEVLDEFFLRYNFGCRQTKGFGGFATETILKMDCVKAYNKMGYPFFYADARIPANTDAKQKYGILLNHAMTLYALLKGGLNLPGNQYVKAYIQREYLDQWEPEKYIGSDKAFTKSCVLKLNGDGDDADYDDYVFIRALLGLADHFEYLKKDYGKPLGKTVTIHHDTIARFPSPIIIKIIGSQLFFLFDVEAVQEILDQEFHFRSTDQNNHPTDEVIRTPKTFRTADARELMSGFVEFFNDDLYADGKRYPAVRSILRSFRAPYNNTANLTLKMGGTQR